jgi:hypothetical protein
MSEVQPRAKPCFQRPQIIHMAIVVFLPLSSRRLVRFNICISRTGPLLQKEKHAQKEFQAGDLPVPVLRPILPGLDPQISCNNASLWYGPARDLVSKPYFLYEIPTVADTDCGVWYECSGL